MRPCFSLYLFFFFFFNDTATTEIYTLSLHDALPICLLRVPSRGAPHREPDLAQEAVRDEQGHQDRKSTRLNSSHITISYAVFCLKKKKKKDKQLQNQTTKRTKKPLHNKNAIIRQRAQ